ncbi:MAG: hypothetical protein IPM48_05590 [Saprospiraceae bacterium]|nr:hypothetical protein [Saprospiraceae bacterium]
MKRILLLLIDHNSLVIILMMFSVFSCDEKTYVPKPRTYPRVILPEHEYKAFVDADCPMIFEIPVYTEVKKDSTFFDEKAPSDCWFNIDFPTLNGSLYCSYQPIRQAKELEDYINESFRMVKEHHIKADYIDEYPFSKPEKVYGMIFNLEGPAASSFQFYLTDSSEHFMRGSLYFNTQVRPDSLKPFYEFIKYDIIHLVNTFEWNK